MSNCDLDDMDRERLVWLIQKRDGDVKRASYFQGRIDEYCAQNAISGRDCPDLALRPPKVLVPSE